MPNDWKKWDMLIFQLTEHCIHRYGIEAVRNWRFTPFMCNNILYGFFTWEEYAKMYYHVWTVLKNIDQNLVIGGPGIDTSVMLKDWDHSFGPWIDFCRNQNCMPDFITLKAYPYDNTGESKAIWDKAKDGILPSEQHMLEDENYLSHDLRKIHLILQEYGYGTDKIAVEAWNSTYSHQDPCNDICYKSAFITKNIMENQQSTWCLGYWCLSDYIMDFNVPRERNDFHGDFGLITSGGLRKSAYYAMKLLKQVSGVCLTSGNNYFIARDKQMIFIVVYHYCKYNLFHSDESQISSAMEDPYFFCQDSAKTERTFILQHLNPGEYSIERFVIGRMQGGNTYECWKKSGNPAVMNTSQKEYITSQSQPSYTVERASTQNSELRISCMLDPHDVQLIKIRKAQA